MVSKNSYALFKTVLANLQDGGSKMYAKSVDLYYTHARTRACRCTRCTRRNIWTRCWRR